jgi:hypothetical protein
MWYISDVISSSSAGLRHHYINDVKSFELRNTDDDSYYFVEIGLGLATKYNGKEITDHAIVEKGHVFSELHKNNVYGIADNCLTVINKDDIELLDCIKQPKKKIRKNNMSKTTLVEGDFTHTIFATCTLIEMLKTKKYSKRFKLDQKNITIGLSDWFIYQYKITDNTKLEKLLQCNN